MNTREDHAADRRFALTLAGLIVVEVVLASVADAGGMSLELWLILGVAAVLAAGVLSTVVQHRAEGTPLLGRRHRPRRQ